MAQAIATEQTQPTDDEPSPASGPPRVFSLRFNGTGWPSRRCSSILAVPLTAAEGRLRAGNRLGITIMIGYAIGVGIHTLWRFLQIPRPGRRVRVSSRPSCWLWSACPS